MASLVKQLDKVVAANSKEKMASVVNFLGEETDDVISGAKKFGKQNKVKNIALVVPRPSFNGPPSFKVNEQAELTVMLTRVAVLSVIMPLPLANWTPRKSKRLSRMPQHS